MYEITISAADVCVFFLYLRVYFFNRIFFVEWISLRVGKVARKVFKLKLTGMERKLLDLRICNCHF